MCVGITGALPVLCLFCVIKLGGSFKNLARITALELYMGNLELSDGHYKV